MLFELSDKAKSWHDRVTQFFDDHIYPNEERVAQAARDAEDRWEPNPVLEELKPKAKEDKEEDKAAEKRRRRRRKKKSEKEE